MRVFLDVGAHEGQTLDEVLNPAYDFDRIYAFEPMPAQFAALTAKYSDPRLTLLGYGLSDRTATAPVYGTNAEMEASMYPAKRDVDPSVVTSCLFREASSFFREVLPADAHVVVKLNCEGAEVAILNNLVDSGEVWKIAHVMVDFDVRKIPGIEDSEGELTARLDAMGFDRYAPTECVMQGDTHGERIACWLNGLAAAL